jgi:catechol 2,3-dioxygenase-like lactoylglutathione lyase family enzyme
VGDGAASSVSAPGVARGAPLRLTGYLSSDHSRGEDLMPETTTHITALRTVAVPVADQERALEFYVGTLGFEIRADVTFGGGRRWIEVAPVGAPTTIALAHGPDRGGVDTGIRLTTGDAAAAYADLQLQGVDMATGLLRVEGAPPMFSLRDPDGNLFYVVESPPG